MSPPPPPSLFVVRVVKLSPIQVTSIAVDVLYKDVAELQVTSIAADVIYH